MSSLNAGIILGARGPNIVNALNQGTALAGQTNAIRKKQRLAEFAAGNGAALLAGDAGAVNALAALDPFQAQRFQKGELAMDAQRQNMDLQRRAADRQDKQFQMQAEKYARSISAEQAAAEAQRIEMGVKSALMAQSPEEFDALMSGSPETQQFVGMFGNREAIAARFMSMSEVLKSRAGPKPADEYQRYVQEEAAAGRTPMNRIDFKRAGQKTTRTEVGPDGSVSIVEDFGGGQNKPPKLTVDAAKNTGFYIRTQEANKVIESLEEAGTDFWQQSLDAVPLGLGNYARSPEYQKFDQAKRDFVNAILRRESGAVISDSEFDNADKQYFPVPGDGPEVIEQKRRNRVNAIEGLRVGAGAGASYADGQKARDFKSMTAAQIGQVDIGSLNKEQLEAFSARAEELGY